MGNIVLNKEKSIGRVIYIVEGQRKEQTLLPYIFSKIFDYSVVQVKRNENPYLKFVSKKHLDSQVFIVSAEQSNIETIKSEKGKEYLDNVYKILFQNYNLDPSKAAVYYIFDRDNESNTYNNCKELINILGNSRDNGFESNGLLLLSYPAIESYIKGCIDDVSGEVIKNAADLKIITGKGQYQYNHIYDDEIIKACINMLISMNEILGQSLNMSDLDDFRKSNDVIFEFEEELYNKQSVFRLLSLLSISFIDLGLISVE